MPAAARTCVAFANLAKIGEAGLVVPPGLHAAQVPVVAIRADNVLAFAQRLVGDHLDRRSDRPDRAAVGAEGLTDLVRLRGPERLTEHGEELHLVQPVVS